MSHPFCLLLHEMGLGASQDGVGIYQSFCEGLEVLPDEARHSQEFILRSERLVPNSVL